MTGAGEAKANGCIQRTKALLCSRHVIDGEWVHGFPPRRRGEEITVERIGGRCTRRDAAHRLGCTPDLVGAFIAANLRGVSFTEKKKNHLRRSQTDVYRFVYCISEKRDVE